MNSMPHFSHELNLKDEKNNHIRVHKYSEFLPNIPAGPCTYIKDTGNILSIAGSPGKIYISKDKGNSWEKRKEFKKDTKFCPSLTGALTSTRYGTIILAFPDLSRVDWTWEDKLKDAPDAILPTCVMRSTNGGKSWKNKRTLHLDWSGATRDIIELKSGRIIFTTMKMLHNPGRHSILCYYSDDDGKSWRHSNTIDLGGNGHHGGISESTILEKKDASLLQLIRTNWGELWEAKSFDKGETWHPYGPSGIPASSTPALLKRLHSGRVMLLWNQLYPVGEKSYPKQGGDCIWSAVPCSNFRRELSLSFSENDCKTWTPPMVIARNVYNEERCWKEVCYPYAFEYERGKIWITAHRWGLKMEIEENKFFSLATDY
jgi:sialidase-1